MTTFYIASQRVKAEKPTCSLWSRGCRVDFSLYLRTCYSYFSQAVTLHSLSAIKRIQRD